MSCVFILSCETTLAFSHEQYWIAYIINTVTTIFPKRNLLNGVASIGRMFRNLQVHNIDERNRSHIWKFNFMHNRSNVTTLIVLHVNWMLLLAKHFCVGESTQNMTWIYMTFWWTDSNKWYHFHLKLTQLMQCVLKCCSIALTLCKSILYEFALGN